MKRKTVTTLAPSSQRKLLDYIARYMELGGEDSNFSDKPNEKQLVLLAAANKGKLRLRQLPVPPLGN